MGNFFDNDGIGPVERPKSREEIVDMLIDGVVQREVIIDKLTQLNLKHAEISESYVSSIEKSLGIVERLENCIGKLTDEYSGHLKTCESSRDQAYKELGDVREEMGFLKNLLLREQEITRGLHKEFVAFASGVASSSNTSNINVHQK